MRTSPAVCGWWKLGVGVASPCNGLRFGARGERGERRP
ncbi:hypothetical protein chiPu_0029019, partial [Chiloscyllium punctatum]|nr:hypothetical protein [Chiloscyllium punctatum]